jgi:hypothetical protein
MDIRYPIGKYQSPSEYTDALRTLWIEAIAQSATRLREAVAGLSEEHLQTPYREGGWTLRQVVHHVPDSQMHAYIRFKLALTEDSPTIKPYLEAPTALLADYLLPVEVSLDLLENINKRWVSIMQALKPSDFERQVVHPELGVLPLNRLLGLYVWHTAHHTAHITELRKAKGW